MKKKKNQGRLLLKDNLDEIMMYFNMKRKKEKIFLKNIVADERMINYNYLFLKQVILFLEIFGTLPDLLLSYSMKK